MKREKALWCIGLLVLLLVTAGCGWTTYKPVTAQKFEKVMADHNFKVQDVSDRFTEESIMAARTASQEDEDYQIEFQVYAKPQQAQDAFQSVQQSMSANREKGATDWLQRTGNYDGYTLQTGGVYYFVARIDATLVYTVAYEEYSEEILSYMKELGYLSSDQ